MPAPECRFAHEETSLNRDPKGAAGKPVGASLSSDDYPQLAALLGRPPGEFRAEIEKIAAAARAQSRPAAQQALQAAAHVLGELYRHKD